MRSGGCLPGRARQCDGVPAYAFPVALHKYAGTRPTCALVPYQHAFELSAADFVGDGLFHACSSIPIDPPGAIEAIRNLDANGLLVVVVSNQAGIARGLYSERDVILLHEKVNAELYRHGTKIDAFYYPHHPEFGEKLVCDCRKPAPGLLLKAQRDWDIDSARSFLIGDKADDMRAGEAIGVTPMLVSTGYGTKQRERAGPGITFVEDLLAASRIILRHARTR